MINFEYKREVDKVKAYGQEYEIPTKTTVFIEKINEINKRINGSKNVKDAVLATWDGVAVYIGEKETQRIFPKENIESIDTDELSAFWMLLDSASSKNTQAVVNKYKPNTEIKKPITMK